jgi:hypothetical protein
MLTISANDLRTFQRCRRQFLLERQWRVLRWRPHSLFRACLRDGVFLLSNGSDPATVVTNARTRFLTEAARPGLDVMTGDPWTVAQDWAGMLGTILTAVSRLCLLTLTRPANIPLWPQESSAGAWRTSAWADDTGTLHRWITVDQWDDEALAREAHGWPVIGDMVMADAPLQLHVIEIGQQRNGRRHSPWARCYRHPVIAGMCRFQRPDGKGGWRKLSGDKWSALWYADQTKPDPAAWCDLMDADHVTPSLLHHVSIAQPASSQASRIRTEILQVSQEIGTALAEHGRTLAGGMEVPMARAACDPVGGPCAWQVSCLGEDHTPAGIAESGLYQIRAAGASERSSLLSPSHRGTVAIA